MITGYNHNIRHRGLLFHVQTEDGGAGNPYVVTILFFNGNVLAQRRRSYEKFKELPEREEIVVAMMKEQHKEIMKDLVGDRLRGASQVIEMETGEIIPPPPMASDPANLPPPPMAKMNQPPPQEKMPPPISETIEVEKGAEKTLDELILEFLNEEED